MNSKFKNLNIFSLSLLLLISIIFMPFLNVSADAVSIPEKPESIYVFDSAEVLSEESEQNLLTRALNLYNHTKTQISIVTVKTLNGQNIETFADEILKKWEIGGVEGNGIILLLDIDEDIYVTISGAALKSKFTSEVLQTVLNEKLEPYFLVSQYEEGVNSFFTEIYYMAEEFSETEESKPAASTKLPEKNDEASNSGPSFFSVLGTILLILLILCAAFIAVVYVRGQIVKKKRREAARRRRAMERKTLKSRRDYL